MLPYRIVTWVNDVYPAMVFFLYLGLAALTFSICFLMPPAAIISLIFAIFALIPAVMTWRLLRASELWLARSAIREDRCPACGYELVSVPDRTDPASSEHPSGSEEGDPQCPCCLGCGAAYAADGTRVLA